MTSTVTLPLWIVILGALALALLIIQRALVPSVRWFFRGRVERAFEELNERLQLKIPAFAITKRRVLVDRLEYDPDVMAAVEAEADSTGEPREVVAQRAGRYAREIVPYFSPMAYFGFGTRLSKFIAQAFYRVRLGYADDEALAEIDPNATVIFVMNHRSNIDYLLVTYLAAERSALSYAAGEWARVWPLEQIAKAMGAFFIRRKSHNPLYRRVLARYVQMATEGGVTQAVFPEGGLSRDGKLGLPKLGLISYVLEDFDPAKSRDVVFVPVGLNYDRVLEDRVLTGAQLDENGRPRFRAGIGTSVKFFSKQLWLRMRGKFHKFGYACVSFGTPVSLRAFVAENGKDMQAVQALGRTLIREVGQVVPILPVALVATVMQRVDGAIAEGDLHRQAAELRAELEARGGHFHLPRLDFDYTLKVGLRMLKERRLMIEEDGHWRVNPDQRHLIDYYANSIAHL
nr:1-acyl-sn-glycerol-3-phosphate acyltransferase [Rubricella aquisinus]